MHRCLLALSLLAALLPGAGAAAQRVEVVEHTLDNGMTFLLVPRDEEPNMISAAWVAKVGSANERPGITGISHFFEHMMFKGTTTIGTREPEADADFMRRQKAVKQKISELVWTGQYERYRRGEIDDPWDPAHDTEELRVLRAELRDLMDRHRDVIVKNEFATTYENAGGTGLNAFTSNDMTFYFINVPSNKFELWAWMESDRLDDSVFREFYSERDVVHEERRMGLESNPTGELDEQFDAMFWQSSPYSWSVIGWPSDLNSYTREQFDAYFNVYYRPNNLVGVVVGDFDLETIKPIIDRYFGRLSPGTVAPPPVVTIEVEQLAEKRMTGSCDCQPQVEVRYHTVPFDHADGFVLDVLAGILNGRTGRLYKSMVEGQEIAASASVMQDSMKYAGYFSFSAQVKGDAAPVDLEQAWYAEVDRLNRELVSDGELQKVMNQISADAYRRLQSNSALLFQLGMYEATGNWEYINEAPPKLLAVTPQDIRRAVATYFGPENRNVALYTRRAGAEPPTDLSALPPEVQARVEAILAQLLPKDDPGELRQIMARLESSPVPPPFEPAMVYIVEKLRQRVRELEDTDEGTVIDR